MPMRMRFEVRIRMRQIELVHIAMQNISAYEPDRKFKGRTSSHTCFSQMSQTPGGISGKVVAFYIVIED